MTKPKKRRLVRKMWTYSDWEESTAGVACYYSKGVRARSVLVVDLSDKSALVEKLAEVLADVAMCSLYRRKAQAVLDALLKEAK